MITLTEYSRKVGDKDLSPRKKRLLKALAIAGVGAIGAGAYLKTRGLKDIKKLIKKKTSSGDEGLDLAFQFQNELKKRQSKLNIPKKKPLDPQEAQNKANMNVAKLLAGATLGSAALQTIPRRQVNTLRFEYGRRDKK